MKKAFAALLVVGLVAGAALALFAASTFPRERGQLRLKGLSGRVTIEEDTRGVPVIRAATSEDALFGQGYVHARDRLWQMEFQRRVGSGRLSEMLGPSLLPADRFLRTVGFRLAAEAAWPALSADARQVLEAYARGANAYLAADRARPAELRILRIEPEPFTPVDCLVWAKMMAWDLGQNARDEIRRAGYLAKVGPERAAEMFPEVPLEPTILLDEEWVSSFEFRVSSSPPHRSTIQNPKSKIQNRDLPWHRLGEAFDRLAHLGLTGEELGSNSWVVGGARSITGKPLLANDPHLGFKTPSLWYLVRLEAPGLSVAGATLPGLPGVIIGHNARVGWGLTSVEADVQDLYLEEVDPKDPARYRFRGEWKSFETRQETIRVRGQAAETFTARASVHGPIVTDVLSGANALGRPVALRWTGLDPGDTTAESFLGFDKAGNWQEFLAAASRLKAPAQNVVYADVDGHIGYATTGAIPIRARGDGLLPVSGAGDDEWTGTIPFEKLPRVLDPPRGFVVTANNRVVSPRYPWLIARDWPEPYRARRIADRLAAVPKLSPDDMRSIQTDQLSYQARDLLPLLLDTAPADAASRDALARLRAWDGSFDAASVPASIYAAWYAALSAMPEDELGRKDPGSTRSRFLIRALRSESPWCDDIRTAKKESCGDFKAAALTSAVATLKARLGSDPSAWAWGRLHTARSPHDVFERVGLLRPFFSLEVGQGGDGSTVNVGSYRRDGSFVMTAGASYRQILDFADLSRSRFVLTTGQSGNVFDRRYRDQLPLWHEGASFEIGAARPVKTLELLPEP
ncbi:MAG TPA: penicillin acylase family protein [Thermoanaerobaculia bacterium]|nr:penicillin acylase family protein [Thermoanaerobaculia bacterium]